MLFQCLSPVTFFLHSRPRHSEVLALSQKTIMHLKHGQSLGAAGREATRVQLKCPDVVCARALVLLPVGSYAPSLTRGRFWPNSFFAESCAAPRLSRARRVHPAPRDCLSGCVAPCTSPSSARVWSPHAPATGTMRGVRGLPCILRPLPSSRRRCTDNRR